MEIPNFSGDGDEIDPKEWFRMVKERKMFPSSSRYHLSGDAKVWWNSLPRDVRLSDTWEEYEKIFRKRWIDDENLNEIQEELKEAKEELMNKGVQLSKLQALNDELIKEVNNLKQGKMSKCKKDEEIYRLRNHNKTLLDEVKRLKEEKKNFQNQENKRIMDEETTKRLEVEICKKVEEELGTEATKLEIQERIKEGRNKLMENITIQLQKEKEEKIQEGHQKILEEVELQLADVQVKYDGIISKSREIKDQAQKIEEVITSEKKIDDIVVQIERKPSKEKPYRHPHYQESLKERHEDQLQHYQRRGWNNQAYSWNMASHNNPRY